jgi:hypothetical protein
MQISQDKIVCSNDEITRNVIILKVIQNLQPSILSEKKKKKKVICIFCFLHPATRFAHDVSKLKMRPVLFVSFVQDFLLFNSLICKTLQHLDLTSETLKYLFTVELNDFKQLD